MGDQTRGLYGKFNVTRKDGSSAPGGKHCGCDYFVLDLTHDPHAFPALVAYRNALLESNEYKFLCRDLTEKIHKMKAQANAKNTNTQ